MTQGRKSRTVLALVCALAALSVAALAPTFASGQAAQNEYDLTLPGAGGSGDAGGSQDQGSATGASGSDDGGAPIVLIGLAALAAVGAGAAIWRLRDRTAGRTNVGPGAPEAASETQ
jgi:hypothetical protein